LAVDVLVAVSERDAAIQAAERGAGEALRVMTDREGLSLREVVEWCCGEMTLREATRMRRLVNDPVVRFHEPHVDPSVRDKRDGPKS
jgi:hypothetical protein